MTNEQAKLALADLFYYLDMVEESDSGREFRPNTITSCRVMDGVAIEKLLTELKRWAQ